MGHLPQSAGQLWPLCPQSRTSSGILVTGIGQALLLLGNRDPSLSDFLKGPGKPQPYPSSILVCVWLEEAFAHGTGSPRPGPIVSCLSYLSQ